MKTGKTWTVMAMSVGYALVFYGTVGVAGDAPVAAAAGKNLVSNGSFEEGPDGRPKGWAFWVGAGAPKMSAVPGGHSGQRSASITGVSNTDHGVCYQNIKVTPKASYRLTLWYRYAKQTGEPGAVRFGATTKPLAPGNTEWTQMSFTVQAGDKETERLGIFLYQRQNTLIIDDVELAAE